MPLKSPSSDDRPIWDIWLSVYGGTAMSAADELRLFEALDVRPASASELADEMGWNRDALKTLLPLLASIGLLAVRLGRYHLTAASRTYLLRDSTFYWGHAFSILRTNPTHAQFVAAVTAAPARPAAAAPDADARPVEAWESGQITREMARTITAFMHSHSLPAALGVAKSADFNGVSRLLDVGGGSGCFAIALADRRPDLRCTVMELPAVCEVALDYIAAAGLQERVDTIVVDMFRQKWPTGYDAIFMSNIFHDWNMDTCARLAASAYAALPSGGRIYLHEMLINDDGSGPRAAASFSAMMLLGTRGRQYSFAEMASLLEGAGFVETDVSEAYGHFSLVHAVKR